METNRPKSSNSKKKPIEVYARYSAIIVQMAAIIFGLTYLGLKLDEHYKTKSPYFTTSFALFSVFLAIYFSIKDFLKKQNR